MWKGGRGEKEEGSLSGYNFKLSFIVSNRVWVSGEEKVTKKNRIFKENGWIGGRSENKGSRKLLKI